MIHWGQNTRATFMAGHGFALIALGLAIAYVRATMTNLFFTVIGSVVASLLIVAALVFLSALDWICAIGSDHRQIVRLRWLLTVGTAAAAIALLLVFYSETTVAMFCRLLALYSGCLALGKLELARLWRGPDRDRTVIYALAFGALIFSLLLALAAPRDERLALAILALYCIFTGVQILLTLHLLRARTALLQTHGART